ncbi:MAG: hypothetical protein SOR89_02705 [Ndongobacter sp.]|nr:hypothetical protein [Ndongobacter sp.]
MPADLDYRDQLIGLFEETDSLHRLFEVSYASDEQKARADLESGAASVVVVLPSDVVSSIMSGENHSPKVYFSSRGGVEQALFRGLLNWVSDIVSNGQVLVYTLYSFWEPWASPEARQSVLLDANRYGLSVALAHASFSEKIALAGVRGDAAQERLLGFFLLALALSAVVWIPVQKRELEVTRSYLDGGRSSAGLASLSATLSMSLFLTGLFFFGSLLFSASADIFGNETGMRSMALLPRADVLTGLSVFVGMLALSGWLQLLMWCGRSRYAVLWVLLLILGFGFMNGWVLPPAYLPKGLRLGGYLSPMPWIAQLIRGGFSEQASIIAMGGCTAWVLLSTGLTAYLRGRARYELSGGGR